MAEPASTSPPTAGVAERGVLLATKLHLPSTRPGFVPRARLLQRLTDGLAGELTLVCAPAGFGKTALLADWARGSPRPVAWLSLDAGDNDPARFWRYVAAALNQVRAGIGEQLSTLLDPPPQSFEAMVTALVNQFAAGSESIVLVLDDYHVIEAAPVHDSIGFLLGHQPPELRLILASRSDPPLGLARLRGGGQLAELRAADLRFSQGEAAAVLHAALGTALPEAAVAALAARTEGWAVGLQLAALSLRGHADPAGFVAGFSGSHRHVLDYLTQEVLDRQPEPLVSFLLETSVLERLSGPLCDAITGRTDSQRLLEQIEWASLFLVPLDEVRGWWRYHHLFADLLRTRLQQAEPDRVLELHRTAAAWYEDHGLVDDAVHHALAAGDAAWAAWLVGRHAQALLERGEGATLHRWLAALPPDVVRSQPKLCLAQAATAILGGRLDEAEALHTQAEHAYHAADPSEPSEAPAAGTPSGLDNIPGMLAWLGAELARRRGDADATIQFAQQSLALADAEDQYLNYFGRWNLAVGTLLQGRVADAEAALGELAADLWATGSQRYFAVHAHYMLAQVHRAQGRLGAALRSCQQGLEIAAPAGGAALPVAGVALVGLAEILRERGELDAALDHATQGVALCRQLAYPQQVGTGLATLAWVRQARGDQAGALAAIGEAEQAVPNPEAIADLFLPVAVQRARLWLAHGQVAQAARWVSERGLGAEDEPNYAREREQLVLARVLLAEQTPEPALWLLERLHDLAAAQGRMGSVLEVRALQALALQAVGDQTAALAALAEALTLAAPEDWLRVFVDEGAPMAALLGKLAAPSQGRATVAAQVPPAYLGRLLDAFERAGLPVLARPRRGGAMVAGLIEPLSARELEVLQLLAAGRPNQAIAEELVVTLETVKSHVAHILGKLGVANRTQAVARARELGLLG
jgi:LuxR family transcriptional regulator, maltose regulon positive regulatory protein